MTWPIFCAAVWRRRFPVVRSSEWRGNLESRWFRAVGGYRVIGIGTTLNQIIRPLFQPQSVQDAARGSGASAGSTSHCQPASGLHASALPSCCRWGEGRFCSSACRPEMTQSWKPEHSRKENAESCHTRLPPAAAGVNIACAISRGGPAMLVRRSTRKARHFTAQS